MSETAMRAGALIVAGGLALIAMASLLPGGAGGAARVAASSAGTGFSNPRPIAIHGYDGTAKEPFLSRDGGYLFFNNSNDAPGIDTKIYYARRIDDTNFAFIGEVRGVNTPSIEAVPSLDRRGNFYLISNRSYDRDRMTVYRGAFARGTVSGLAPVEGVSRREPPWFNMDAEISADGRLLYFTDNDFRSGKVQTSKIAAAARNRDGSFTRLANADALLATVNGEGFNYAPASSADGRELFFTRKSPGGVGLFVARRASDNAPFGPPALIAAAGPAFVEAPTISPDGRTLYYARQLGRDRFAIYMTSRPSRGR